MNRDDHRLTRGPSGIKPEGVVIASNKRVSHPEKVSWTQEYKASRTKLLITRLIKITEALVKYEENKMTNREFKVPGKDKEKQMTSWMKKEDIEQERKEEEKASRVSWGSKETETPKEGVSWAEKKEEKIIPSWAVDTEDSDDPKVILRDRIAEMMGADLTEGDLTEEGLTVLANEYLQDLLEGDYLDITLDTDVEARVEEVPGEKRAWAVVVEETPEEVVAKENTLEFDPEPDEELTKELEESAAEVEEALKKEAVDEEVTSEDIDNSLTEATDKLDDDVVEHTVSVEDAKAMMLVYGLASDTLKGDKPITEYHKSLNRILVENDCDNQAIMYSAEAILMSEGVTTKEDIFKSVTVVSYLLTTEEGYVE